MTPRRPVLVFALILAFSEVRYSPTPTFLASYLASHTLDLISRSQSLQQTPGELASRGTTAVLPDVAQTGEGARGGALRGD
jgi:hypothetical protein